MRHATLSTFESIVLGFIIGASSPNSLGGLSSWRFWVYIILMNVVVNVAYGVGKAWWQDCHLRKNKA